MREIAKEIIEQVELTIKSFRQTDEEAASKKPAPGKWCKKEIIGHLCDSALNNIQRFVRAQYEHNPTIQYEQDNWVEISDYNTYSVEEILTLWQALNKHLCRILLKMPEEKYNNTCVMMAFGNVTNTYTLKWTAEDYLRHMKHHLKQVNDR